MVPQARFSIGVLSVPECSDAPNWSRLGIFSCHACDLWREKRQFQPSLSTSTERLHLSQRYQCRRRLIGKALKINVVCGLSASGEENTAPHPTEEILDNLICCSTPVNPPAENLSAVTATEGRITRSRQYVTPVFPPPVNSAVITIEGSRTDFVPTSKGPLVRSHRVKKPTSRFLDDEVKSQNTSRIHTNLKRSITARNRFANIKLEAENKLNADLVAEKCIRAKATEKFLIWKEEDKEKYKSCQEAMFNLASEHKRHVEDSEAALNEMKKKLKSTKSLCDYYKNISRTNVPKNVNETEISKSLETALSKVFPGKHVSTKAKMLFDEIMSGRLYGGAAMTVVNDYVHGYIKQLFAPWRLLKASDVSAIGSFKTSTIKALNDVIDKEKIGLFPSPSAVDRARAKLDKYAVEMIGYERKETIYGEVFYLNFQKALRLLLKACDLHDRATRERVKISLAIDGADLFKDRTHVSAGVKISDPNGIHPVTKQPLFVRDEDGTEKIIRIQSSELCCILIIADARDKKDLYDDVFRGFYEWGSVIGRVGLPADGDEPPLHPFIVSHTTDLKASWYLSNRGGGCKNKNFFCTFCPCTRHSLISYKVGSLRCCACKRKHKSKCYHHAVCDSVSVPSLLCSLEEELGQYHKMHRKSFERVRERSKLRTDYMQLDKTMDITHIEYVIPPDNEEKLREYTQFISNECMLRSIPLNGRLEDWRQALLECVQLERSISLLENVKKWHEQGLESVPLVDVVELLIPCILHCENRIGEKILTILLRRQLDHYRGRKEEFVENIECILQREVLGTEQSPSHWRLKHSKDPTGQVRLEPVQVRNQIVRKLMDKFDVIVESIFPESEGEFRGKVILAVTSYKEAISMLTMHRNLSAAEKELFQEKVDFFYEMWIELFGEEGITNYIHILGSGHMMYFLEKYDCLYMYSQQGWEDLNNRCQAFLMQNTSRGGYGSGEGKGKSYTFPIVRYILRDLLWKTGLADDFFST